MTNRGQPRETKAARAQRPTAPPRVDWSLAGRRAFTLVELMVAMVVASVLMYGVYFIYERSTAAFRVQNDLADMFQQHRFGLSHLKRDIRRAGFQTTTNSTVDESVCFNPTGSPLHGLELGLDSVNMGRAAVVHQQAVNVNVDPSSISLFGDFWSRGAFRVHRVAGSRIELDGTFYYDENGDGVDTELDMPSDTELTSWFRQGRLVRLLTPEGRELYLHVATFQRTGGGPPPATWPVLTLREAVPVVWDGSGCGVAGLGSGGQLNPAGFVRYAVRRDTRPGADVGKFDLVREELDPDTRQPMPNSQLVITEYAVELQFYDFVFDEGTAQRPALNIVTNNSPYPYVTDVVGSGGSGRLGNSNLAEPHRLRALTAKLSVRAPTEDPKQTFRPRRNIYTRFTSFELEPELEGAARVYSGGGRVVLDNFLTRNLL